MLTTQQRADRVVLYGISWQQFENILKELGASRGARVAYFEGILEIMTPLPEHEYYKEAIADAIKDIAEALERDYECLGSTTWRHQVGQAGLEPDNCFIFKTLREFRGKFNFDLNRDPPPDLALEIDITSKSLNRFPIYIRLGVPEIWCYEAGELKIYQLQGEEYREVTNSLVFPELPIKEIPKIIEHYRLVGRLPMRQAFRQWAKRNR